MRISDITAILKGLVTATIVFVSVISNAEEAELIKPWFTYQGDEKHSGYKGISIDPADIQLRWEKSLNVNGSLGRVSAGNGNLFISKSGILYNISSYDGSVIWQRDFSKYYGGASTPVFADGKVYVETTDYEGWWEYNGSTVFYYLWGIDIETNTIDFKKRFSGYGDQHDSYLTLTPYNDGVYMVGGTWSRCFAFNANTGSQIWSKSFPSQENYAPAVDDDYIYSYNGAQYPQLTVADRNTGNIVFQIKHPHTKIGYSWHNYATVLGDQRNAIVVHDNRLISFDLEARDIGFEITGKFFGQPAVANGTIYAINNNKLDARSEADGSIQWRWESPQPTENLDDLFIITKDLAFIRTESTTYAVDLETHKTVWSYPISGEMAIDNMGVLYITAGEKILAFSLNGDSDMDGIPDWWETENGLDPTNSADALLDTDNDGLTNIEEYNNSTKPMLADSDSDGLTDGEEINTYETDPNTADSDQDGLLDYQEVITYKTNPNSQDSDNDIIPDLLEIEAGMDPNDPNDATLDLDGDGYSNLEEYYAGSGINDADSIPIKPWAMFQGDAGHTGYMPLKLDANMFSHMWTVAPDSGNSTSAIAIDGKVFVSNNGKLFSLDMQDGEKLWFLPLEGGHAAPSFGNDMIYVHTNWGHLYGVDADTSELLFQTSNDTQGAYFNAPTIYGENIYMDEGNDGGMLAKNALDGTTLWSTNNQAKWPAYWEPAVDDQYVYAPYYTDLTIRDKITGELIYTIENAEVKTPVLRKNGDVLTYKNSGRDIKSFRIGDQSVTWTASASSIPKIIGVGGGIVAAVTKNTVEVFNEITGVKRWKWSSTIGSLNDQLIITATHMFVCSDTKTVAIDLNSKQEVWSYPAGGKLSIGHQGVLMISDGSELTLVDMLGDVDGDGIPTWWENQNGLDPEDPSDALLDTDADGLTSLQEYHSKTEILNADSDKDGLSDGEEVHTHRTDPTNLDSDDDGLNDYNEIYTHLSNPLLSDSDNDKIPDAVEIAYQLDPNNPDDANMDHDSDGHSNLNEYLSATNINNPDSYPQPKKWAMYQGDSAHSGYMPWLLDSTNFEHMWTIESDIGTLYSPIAIDDKIYATANNYGNPILRSFDLQDGKELWSLPLDIGTVTPPIYGNGLVYVHTCRIEDEMEASLLGVDAETGSSIFYSSFFSSKHSFVYEPTIYDSIVYIDGGDYRQSGGMIAMNAMDGTTIWSAGNETSSFSPATAIDDQYVYTSYWGDLNILDRNTGSLQAEIVNADSYNTVLTSDDHLLTYNKYDNLIKKYDIEGKSLSWNATVPGKRIEAIAVGRGLVLAICDEGLTAFNEASGKRKWHWPGKLHERFILTASHVFVSSYAGRSNGFTAAINLDTQEVEWEYPAGGRISVGDQQMLMIANTRKPELITISLTPGPDTDNDGLNDRDEINLGTDPNNPDTDGDTFGDGIEVSLSMDPLVLNIPGDLDNDSYVGRADLNIIKAARNTPALLPKDPRDINGDGTISATDMRALVGICTKPRCQ